LLADRFHLVSHRETREMSRYKLVIAKGGPKLSPAQKPPEYKDDEERKAAVEKQLNAKLEAMRRTPRAGSFRRFGSSGTMANLAESLSTYVDRPVMDATGLEGSYSYSLEWSPDESSAAADNPLPSIFVALQEQLGLKLEPEKGPVEFLVIERAEKTPVVN
jgi:uncharacterized protein (TIGR03435 family)